MQLIQPTARWCPSALPVESVGGTAFAILPVPTFTAALDSSDNVTRQVRGRGLTKPFLLHVSAGVWTSYDRPGIGNLGRGKPLLIDYAYASS